MNTKIIFILIFLFFAIETSGQVVSQSSYHDAVDKLNCLAVEKTLTPKENGEDYVEFQRKFPCARSFAANKIIPFLGEKGNEKTIKLSQEIESLKGAFNPKWTIDEAVAFLSEEVFKDSAGHPELSGFASRRSNDSTYPQFTARLKAELSYTLKPDKIASDTTPVSDPGQKSETSTGTGILGPLSSLLSFANAMLVLLAAGLVGLTVWAYLRISKLYGATVRLENRLGSIERATRTTVPSSPGPSPRTTDSARIDHLTYQLERHDVRIKDLEFKSTENAGIDEKPQSYDLSIPVFEEKVHASEPRIEVSYFPAPHNDGTFSVESGRSSPKEGATIYKLTRISHNEAKFEIDENLASIRLALQYPEATIDPVCEALNDYDAQATKIITVPGSGRVILAGDRWTLKNKAQIRYEH